MIVNLIYILCVISVIYHSFSFIAVFPLLFLLYYVIPAGRQKVRNAFLLVVSYLLYMSFNPAFALVLLGVTLITYWGGQLLKLNGEAKTRRKRLACVCSLLALLPLLVFKYYNFLSEGITAGLSRIGWQFALPGLNWAVPIGISFFTFQAIGYLLDVYNNK